MRRDWVFISVQVILAVMACVMSYVVYKGYSSLYGETKGRLEITSKIKEHTIPVENQN